MELKERKAIQNKVLPKFAFGWEQPSLDDTIGQAGSFQHSSKTEGVTSAADAFKADVMALNNPVTKKAGVGSFLKNNAGGIMNIASSAIDFVGTMSDISKNKLSSDEMMGSGGTTTESANGISYQQSRVDEAGYLNQINATAKAGTMAAMGKGAALGSAVGSVIPGLGTVAGGVIGGVVGGIAGLFGSKKAKREAERQKKIAIDRTVASNTQNREDAYTIGLRNEFNRENRTDTSQSLFHAAEGKEGKVNPVTGETYNDYIVNTAFGKIKAPQNAWVSAGEVIRSADGSLYRVPQTNRSGNPDTAMPRYAYGVASNKKFKADTERAHLMPGDSVYSNVIINPETGNSIADDAASYAMAGQLDRLDMNLNVGRMMKEAGRRKTNLLPGFLGGTNKYKCLPRFENGWQDTYLSTITGVGDSMMGMLPGTTVTGDKNKLKRYSLFPDPDLSKTPNIPTIQIPNHGLPQGNLADPVGLNDSANPENTSTKKPGLFGKIKGVLGGLGGDIDLGNIALLGNAYLTAAQRDARAEGLRAPKSFVANPYEQDALQLLNKLHSDYYPVWAQNRELEGRGKSSIMQSGGLSAGLKMLGYMGLANQTQQNNASALFEHQGRENALRAQAAKASLEAGNQSATRQQQAYQWDEDMLAKAHAAQENMLETSAYDRQNGLTQFFKNAWEKNQFDRTMNLYESQQKDDHAKTLAIINNLGTKNTPVTLNGVAGNAAMLQVDPTTGKFVRTNPFSASQLLTQGTKKSIDSTNSIMNAATNIYNNAINNAKKVAKPKVTKRRTVKRGGKK